MPKDNPDIEDLDLSIRAKKCLDLAGIRDIKSLCALTEQQLMRFPNFGRKSLRELKEALAGKKLSLKDDKAAIIDQIRESRAGQAVNELEKFIAEGIAAERARVTEAQKSADYWKRQAERSENECHNAEQRHKALRDRFDREKNPEFLKRLNSSLHSERVQRGALKTALHSAHLLIAKLQAEISTTALITTEKLEEAKQSGWTEGFRACRDVALVTIWQAYGIEAAKEMTAKVWPPMVLDRSKPAGQVFGGRTNGSFEQGGESFNAAGFQVVWLEGEDEPRLIETKDLDEVEQEMGALREAMNDGR